MLWMPPFSGIVRCLLAPWPKEEHMANAPMLSIDLAKRSTQTINALRGHLAEFGLVFPKAFLL